MIASTLFSLLLPAAAVAAVGCTKGRPSASQYPLNSTLSSATASCATFTTVIRPSTSDGPTKTEACAIVSSIWAAQTSGGVATPTVEAKLANDCLKSVPLHKDEAIELVDAIRPYVEWQSNLAFLKDPPADYEPGPFDVVGHLKIVRERLVAGKYDGELAFQEDLFKMTTGARDGHFEFLPDALTKVFHYARPFDLVSYSKDPLSMPVIKMWNETSRKGDAARVVSRLNGMDASNYIQQVVNSASSHQDLDAGYNIMFFSQAKRTMHGVPTTVWPGGRHQYLYPGENMTVEYDTGEIESAANTALILVDFSGVTDGESFFNTFCTTQSSAFDHDTAVQRMSETYRRATYPEPILSSNDSAVSGYYLEDEGLSDVAVLYIAEFNPESPRLFQMSVELFLAQCKMDGKAKIIVDLQMNGGGYILQGNDLFRQFFPDIEQDSLYRWRQNEQFLALAQIASAAAAEIDPRTSVSKDAIHLWASWWNYRQDLNSSGQPFESFEAKFPSHGWTGDSYTAIMKTDLNNTFLTSNKTAGGIGIEITGYGSRRDFVRPFEPQNIILLTDGYCASTCSLFHTGMKTQGKVKTVAFGGRPNKRPMQAVGGVKGGMVLWLDDIHDIAQVTISSELIHVSAEQKASLSKLTALPIQRSTRARVNVRDQILRENLEDGVPTQLLNEPADCRLFWTLPMLRNVAEVWKAAARAAWNGAGCVSGVGFEKARVGEKIVASNTARLSRTPVVITVADLGPGDHFLSEEEVQRYSPKVDSL